MPSEERHILGQHEQHENSRVRDESEAVVQLREEELAARKRPVEAGRVSLGTEVVEEQQTMQVPVTHEEVTVDRHPVDRRPSDQPIGATAESLRVPVREDHVAVDKRTVVYEEANVGKRAVEETRRISDRVRREVVDVDASGDVQVSGEPDTPR